MDLVTLLHRIPPLLHACIDSDGAPSLSGVKEIARLRALRLVNKEFGRVALLGLRSYTLTLTGPLGLGDDTNVSGARLLQNARLERLRVNLHLSGSHSPALLLTDFLREVGASLSTVTSLVLCYNDTGGSSFTAAILGEAMAVLAAAFPSLKSLNIQGQVPVAFLRSLGEASPLLTSLATLSEMDDVPYLQRVLQLQPSLLPHISSLALTYTDDDTLPDMSQNMGITTLKINNFSMQDVHWLLLPRKLQHLMCSEMHGGPPPSADSRDLFVSLLSAEFDRIVLPLPALAKMLRRAPFPHQFSKDSFTVLCSVDQSTAADLLLVHQHFHMDQISDFEVRCSGGSADEEWFAPCLATLPCMTGVTQCSLDCSGANLLPMLAAFPNVNTIYISHSNELGNHELCALAVCKQLRCIDLEFCNRVTAMGLLALCQHLPGLVLFQFENCEQLQGPEVEMCVQLLKRYGLNVHVADHGMGPEDIDAESD